VIVDDDLRTELFTQSEPPVIDKLGTPADPYSISTLLVLTVVLPTFAAPPVTWNDPFRNKSYVSASPLVVFKVPALTFNFAVGFIVYDVVLRLVVLAVAQSNVPLEIVSHPPGVAVVVTVPPTLNVSVGAFDVPLLTAMVDSVVPPVPVPPNVMLDVPVKVNATVPVLLKFTVPLFVNPPTLASV